jgi:hypothetical protein
VDALPNLLVAVGLQQDLGANLGYRKTGVLIPSGQHSKKERRALFFISVLIERFACLVQVTQIRNHCLDRFVLRVGFPLFIGYPLQ